jgi:hypothetical protein
MNFELERSKFANQARATKISMFIGLGNTIYYGTPKH